MNPSQLRREKEEVRQDVKAIYVWVKYGDCTCCSHDVDELLYYSHVQKRE